MPDIDEDKGPRGIDLGLAVYQQIASVIGAFALVAFVSHFVDFDWHGFFAVAIAGWNEYIRPAIAFLFDLVVTQPAKTLFGVTIEVPLLIRDYVSVGMVLFASAVRVDLWVRGRGLTDFLSEQEDARLRGKLGYEPSGDEPIWDDKGEYRYRYRSRIGYPSYFFICLLAWPYVVATTIRLLFSGVKLGRVGLNGYDVRTAWLLTLSPVIYFALLAVANFALQLSDRANMG